MTADIAQGIKFVFYPLRNMAYMDSEDFLFYAQPRHRALFGDTQIEARKNKDEKHRNKQLKMVRAVDPGLVIFRSSMHLTETGIEHQYQLMQTALQQRFDRGFDAIVATQELPSASSPGTGYQTSDQRAETAAYREGDHMHRMLTDLAEITPGQDKPQLILWGGDYYESVANRIRTPAPKGLETIKLSQQYIHDHPFLQETDLNPVTQKLATAVGIDIARRETWPEFTPALLHHIREIDEDALEHRSNGAIPLVEQYTM